MAKKTKKIKGNKITITQIEVIQSTRNQIHFDHITNGIHGGAFGGSKRDKRRRDRRKNKRGDDD